MQLGPPSALLIGGAPGYPTDSGFSAVESVAVTLAVMAMGWSPTRANAAKKRLPRTKYRHDVPQ
jgi:hypothetical protein